MTSLLSEYGGYLLIPIIAAFAGWGTNWLAIKMTFYPLEYVGVFPFGWRGVVPSRIRKFASGLVDTTIGRIGGLPVMLESIDTDEVKKQFLDTASGMIARVVHDLMRDQKRVMWENLPAATKKRVFQLVDEGLIEPRGRYPKQWRFHGRSVRRVRCVLRLERDLGVNLAGAALALELLEEVQLLRTRLSRFQDL